MLGEAIHEAASGYAPESSLMIGIVALALVANVLCLILLARHRDDGVNMRSSWVCSRNDLFANSGVIAAGVLVMITGSVWRDVIAGFAIAVLFLQSSVGVLRDAWHRYAQSGVPAGSTTSETRP